MQMSRRVKRDATQWSAWLCAALMTGGLLGCDSGSDGSMDAGLDDGYDWDCPDYIGPGYRPTTCGGRGGPDIPFVDDRPWSLDPVFDMLRADELARFESGGVTLSEDDFTASEIPNSVAAQFERIYAVLGAERGSGSAAPDTEFQARAENMPFRAHPSDVKLYRGNNERRAIVPLGGSIDVPGNEVAIVDLETQSVTRVAVGLRPQRVAVLDDAGLALVCNQYSNYISVIDLLENDLLIDPDGGPETLLTSTYCSDIALVERRPGVGRIDELYLYVLSEYDAKVMRYRIDIVRDINNAPVDVIISNGVENVAPVPVPEREAFGIGDSPHRLQFSEDGTRLLVTNDRGSDLALVDAETLEVLARRDVGAPTLAAASIGGQFLATTTTPYRGLLRAGDEVPEEVSAEPRLAEGVDGHMYEVHPGAQFDATASYNYEDVRSGILVFDADLADEPVYYTDDNEADALFAEENKLLAGALPWDIARDNAGAFAYVALLGSDLVQELAVTRENGLRLAASGRSFATSELPAAVALDEGADALLVATRGGGFLEVFDRTSGERTAQIDLGYASPRYPATAVEAGEYFFASATWSNDGRKSCVSCHLSEFITDGLSFSQGTTAPTSANAVQPVHNLLRSNTFGWSGSAVQDEMVRFSVQAQTRSNCELLLYGLVDGLGVAPAERGGDPANFTAELDTTGCVADTANQINGLPAPLANADRNGDGAVDFLDIQAAIAAQDELASEAVSAAVQPQLERVGLYDAGDAAGNREAVIRALWFYSVSQQRLPPNPYAQRMRLGLYGPAESEYYQAGRDVFLNKAECDACHIVAAEGATSPFTDGRRHGAGGDFAERFTRVFEFDPLLAEIPGFDSGFPQQLKLASAYGDSKQEQSFVQAEVDSWKPLCFDTSRCLDMGNPLSAGPGSDEEFERMYRLGVIGFAQPGGFGFVPGFLFGEVAFDTPSLRGLWMRPRLLHHGRARSTREVILPPGDGLLDVGEAGYGINRFHERYRHGWDTDALSEADLQALSFFLRAIE
ncbi:hypothetical protein Hoch_0078 [Haliangium ochraceum DSM 14365]|uniref:Cytochrome c domain-containing protein n=1 Tax=Haliangium ochraceum (strain DSM 14365 / JCM 11303 / SMP-2) TaxID=502025 RepID=D0LGH3_HALO1|nr:hypothetical protein Hoch_0078 [Haliangium ochraceum DSM 14365]